MGLKQKRVLLSDSKLMKQHSGGVKPSPKQWVQKYADYLFAFASLRIRDEDLARDLVQETFLAALERLDKFEGNSSEKTWLTAILKNKIVDVYRKQASGLGNTVQISDFREEADFFDAENGHWLAGQQPQAFAIDLMDPLGKKEFQSALKNCLDKLPSLWLSVFTMKHIDEEPTKVITDRLRLTPSNFWVIMHRTKVNLRSCLQNANTKYDV